MCIRDRDSIDVTGLEITDEQLEDSITVDAAEWKAELEDIDEWFSRFGDSLPQSIRAELEELRNRVA